MTWPSHLTSSFTPTKHGVSVTCHSSIKSKGNIRRSSMLWYGLFDWVLSSCQWSFLSVSSLGPISPASIGVRTAGTIDTLIKCMNFLLRLKQVKKHKILAIRVGHIVPQTRKRRESRGKLWEGIYTTELTLPLNPTLNVPPCNVSVFGGLNVDSAVESLILTGLKIHEAVDMTIAAKNVFAERSIETSCLNARIYDILATCHFMQISQSQFSCLTCSATYLLHLI